MEEGLAIEAATFARVEQAEQEARAGQERTQWPPGAGSLGSRNGAGSGADSVGSRNGAGSGADSVGSRNGAGSGAGTTTLGGASLGMPAAHTELIGGSSSLCTSTGIPECAAGSSATTRDTAALSAATGGATVSSHTT